MTISYSWSPGFDCWAYIFLRFSVLLWPLLVGLYAVSFLCSLPQYLTYSPCSFLQNHLHCTQDSQVHSFATDSLEHQAGVFNYVSHFSSLCDKIPEENNSKNFRFIVALGSRACSHDCLSMERLNFTAEDTWWSKASHLREGWETSVLMLSSNVLPPKTNCLVFFH